ncbi:MAG: hypothetical protein ACRCWS_03365 [Propionibacteriaceae bacterium]
MSNNSNSAFSAFVGISAGLVIMVTGILAATMDGTARWISLAILAIAAVVAGFALYAAKTDLR